MPNFSFPTSFNQTTASSSNQTFLLVPDRPPPGEVVQYFEFEMIGSESNKFLPFPHQPLVFFPVLLEAMK